MMMFKPDPNNTAMVTVNGYVECPKKVMLVKCSSVLFKFTDDRQTDGVHYGDNEINNTLAVISNE